MNRIAVFAAIAFLTGTSASNYDSPSQDILRLLLERPWTYTRGDRLPVSMDTAPSYQPARIEPRDNGLMRNYVEDDLRANSIKRSAVATAMNGRRRRQPAPALGKAVTPYVGVGVLNDVGSFFDTLRDNLETLASLSPQQRSSLFHDVPSVVPAPLAGSGGGGIIRRPHALRPLRTSTNMRSFVDPDVSYPGANHHDPGLLWTGLGR